MAPRRQIPRTTADTDGQLGDGGFTESPTYDTIEEAMAAETPEDRYLASLDPEDPTDDQGDTNEQD